MKTLGGWGYSGFREAGMIEGFGEGAGVEFWILGFFGVGKFGKYFFLLGGGGGELDLCSECLGYSKQSELPLACGSARNPSRIVLRMMRNQTCFALVYSGNRLFNRPQRGCIHHGFIQSISHPSCLSTGFIVTEIPFCCRYIIFLETFKARKFGQGFF